jgi:hypothetical protein
LRRAAKTIKNLNTGNLTAHPLMKKTAFAMVGAVLLCASPAGAADDFWQANHCARSKPEPVLVKTGVKGHTFRIAKKRGEALETGTVGGEKITIIHFGCEGTGWQIRTTLKADQNGPQAVYERARKLLKTIAPQVKDDMLIGDVIKILDGGTRPLAERIVAVPGAIETSFSVSTTGEGTQKWLTVMIYTGPT